MKITSGTAKGREVKLPPGVELRPTSDKVKQAMFNALGPAVSGAVVLDLYCGSGNLGLEALSRGAAKACFVDVEARCLESARESAGRFGLEPEKKAAFVCADAFSALRRLRGEGWIFDLVLIDPPYALAAGQSLLNCPDLVAIVSPRPASRVVLEHDSRQAVPQAPGFSLIRTYPYGDTSLSLYLPHANRDQTP